MFDKLKKIRLGGGKKPPSSPEGENGPLEMEAPVPTEEQPERKASLKEKFPQLEKLEGLFKKKGSPARKKEKKRKVRGASYAARIDNSDLKAASFCGKKFLLGMSWKAKTQFDEETNQKFNLNPSVIRKQWKKNNENYQAFCLEKPTTTSSLLNFGMSSWYAPNFFALLPLIAASKHLFGQQNQQLGTTVYGNIIHVFELSDLDNEPFYWVVHVNESALFDDLSDRCLKHDPQTLEVTLSKFRDYLEESNDERTGDIEIIHHSAAESLELIEGCVNQWFSNMKSSVQLYRTERNYKPFIIAAFVLGGLGCAGWYANEWWQEQQRLEQERLFQEQNSQYAKKRIAEEQAKNFPHNWEQQPVVKDIFGDVIAVLTNVPATYNNWKLKQASWSKGSLFVDANYTRKATDLYMPLPNSEHTAELNQKSGNAKFRVWQEQPKKRGKTETLVSEKAVKQYLTGMILGRLWRGKGAIREVETKVVTLRFKGSSIIVKIEADYRQATIQLTNLAFLNRDMWKYFDFPGFVLDKVSKDAKGYSIQGTIYFRK